MQKLFFITVSTLCCLLAQSTQALNSLCPKVTPNSINDKNEPIPDSATLHAAMQEAIASGKRYDWVDAKGNACGGYYQEPANPNPQRGDSPNDTEGLLSAESMEQDAQGNIVLAGNVELYQGLRRVRCDSLRIDQERQYSELNGNIQVREPGMLLVAEQAVFDGQAQHNYFVNTGYLLHDAQARGYSGRIEMSGDEELLITLQDTSFTLCPPNAEHWAFQARQLEIDQEKGWGTLRSGFFKLNNVPVMYIPYLTFPVDDRRKTGVLWPSISGSGSSVDVALPIYFNLAPHYDMTYTPRLATDHGYLHNIEGRYKQRFAEWAVGGSYIYKDKEVGSVKPADDKSLDADRWLAFVKEEGRFDANWTTQIDYQAVSDIHYFRDWGTVGLDVQKSLNIKRFAEVAYNSQDWFASVRVVDYQNLEFDATTNQPMEEDYRSLPAVDLVYRNSLRSFHVEPLLQANYSYFHHDTRLTGHRAYAEPGLSFPMRWQAAEVIPKLKVKTLQYSLDNSNDAAEAHTVGGEYKGSHGKQVPTFSMDSRLFFERRSGDQLSILSPRLFYYYAPSTDQDDLPNFDTAEMAFSYAQLWRESRLSGFDRINDANQVSLGLENSWMGKGRTWFDVGIGQTFYFSDREVSPYSTDRQYLVIDPADTDAERRIKQQINRDIRKTYYRNASDIATQANWYPAPFHTVRGSLIIDPYNNRFSEAALGYHYADEDLRIFNLSYRYKDQPHALDNNGDIHKQATDQVDGSFYLPLAAQWHIYQRTHVDITRSELIENITGVKFEGCCWGVMLAFKRERATFENNGRILDTADAKYQNSWYIQFELKGLGGVTNTISRLLEESIQGFK